MVCVCACAWTRVHSVRLGRQTSPDWCSLTTPAGHSRPATTSTSGCWRALTSEYNVRFHLQEVANKSCILYLLRLIDVSTCTVVTETFLCSQEQKIKHGNIFPPANSHQIGCTIKVCCSPLFPPMSV